MIINPALYVFLVAAIILLSIVLVAVIISYAASMRRLNSLEDRQDDLYEKARQKREELIAQEQTDYEKIITAAQSRAAEIIGTVTKISNTSEDALNKALLELSAREKEMVAGKSQEFLKAYQAQLNQIASDSINEFKNISKDILTNIDSHFNTLKELMSEQTSESQKIAEKKIAGEYEELKLSLAQYKQDQLKKIDNDIYEILLNISKIAFGRGLSLVNQEELVKKAFEEAKEKAALS